MGPFGFLILILVLAAIWMLLVLPARRRRMSHVAMQDSIEVGDEIITAGGMHATVVEFEDDDVVRVEIADGVVARLDRRAVAAVAREIEVEVEAEPDEEPEEPKNGSDRGAEPKSEHERNVEPG